MIRHIALLCLLTPASLLATEVYRLVEEGRVTYTDRPIPGAERVRAGVSSGLPTESTQPVSNRVPAPGPQGPQGPATGGAEAGPYDTFEIATPEDGVEIETGDGRLDLGLMLVPALLPEQRLQVVVDETPVQGEPPPGTQMTLQGLTPGTHQIRAEVLDDTGAVVARTETISVHMRRGEAPEGAEGEPAT